MARHREYELKEIEFKGLAYRKDSRKVIKSNTGLITLPTRFIGKTFDIILIPKEVINEEPKESQTGQS